MASHRTMPFFWLVCCVFTWSCQAADPWPPVASQEDAWKALPAADQGHGEALPVWARMLAPTLPHTTAALIELEWKMRTQPIFLLSDGTPNAERQGDQYLAYVARYAVAEFHDSDYGRASAFADLERTDHRDLADRLRKQSYGFSDRERKVFEFATQMARMGSQLSDASFEALASDLGNEAMVGLVLEIAHGCFQDRLLWALGIADEADAAPTPLYVRFVESTQNGANTPTASRDDPESLTKSTQGPIEAAFPGFADALGEDKKSVWQDADVSTMRDGLERQRTRAPRIPVPDWDTIAPKIPSGLYRRPLRIRWSRVVVGYQPVLGPAWIKCLRVFEQEAHQNRVFEESVFWVVTRSLRCYYCMGHCEMLMEVGGLTPDGIAERTARLEQGRWDTFSPPEQVSFAFARKLTQDPKRILPEDRMRLRTELGDVRALDLIWWSARCQFMTKVSDAFQLQLERDNVFAD